MGELFYVLPHFLARCVSHCVIHAIQANSFIQNSESGRKIFNKMSGEDEESFIILDETPSMEPYSLLQIPTSNEVSMVHSVDGSLSEDFASLKFDAPATPMPSKECSQTHDKTVNNANRNESRSMVSPLSLSDNKTENSLLNSFHCETIGKTTSPSKLGSLESTQSYHMMPSSPSPSNRNLAESFLLGAIDCDTMKVSQLIGKCVSDAHRLIFVFVVLFRFS